MRHPYHMKTQKIKKSLLPNSKSADAPEYPN